MKKLYLFTGIFLLSFAISACNKNRSEPIETRYTADRTGLVPLDDFYEMGNTVTARMDIITYSEKDGSAFR